MRRKEIEKMQQVERRSRWRQ